MYSVPYTTLCVTDSKNKTKLKSVYPMQNNELSAELFVGVCVYLVLQVMRILLGSKTRQARPAVWMVRRAELSWTM